MSRSQDNEIITTMPEMNEVDTNNNENGIRYPELQNEISISQYYEQSNVDIENSRVISDVKPSINLRVLSLNPNGCAPKNQPKMVRPKEAVNNYQIDVLLMNETNTKWNAINISRLEKRMKSIDRESSIFALDSKEFDVTKTDYLPGGVMSVFFSKCSSLINKKEVKVG